MKTKTVLYTVDLKHVLHAIDKDTGKTICGLYPGAQASLYELVPSTFVGEHCEECFPKEKKASFKAKDVEIIQEPKPVRGRII